MLQRLFGVLMMSLSGWLFYETVYKHANVKDSTILTGAVIAPMLLVMGLAYCVLGHRTTEVLGERQSPKPITWIINLAAAAAGFGLYLWVTNKV